MLSGRVVAVSDGDTVRILDGRTESKVRLSGIDAPEKAQPFGAKSKAALAACAHGKPARVLWTKKDRYGRIVGRLLVGDTDCGLEQVRAGLAWHYKRFEREQSEAAREEYAREEMSAREARLGLWSDPSPVPPWDWRRSYVGPPRSAARTKAVEPNHRG